MRKKYFFILFLIVAATAASAAFYITQKPASGPKVSNFNPHTPDEIKSSYVLLNVPFTPQAPNADWEDPRQQDGCEEASLLMAWLWINNKPISPQEAEKAILDMSGYELINYGNFKDTNVDDTAKLMVDYFSHNMREIKINPSIDDIKDALRAQKLVLAPVNGQKLNNPHYKRPGPTTHMLVIKGFDDSKNQFITNDPGTRFGESYIYDYQTVYDAMVDYPSGNNGSQEGRPKAMIAIGK